MHFQLRNLTILAAFAAAFTLAGTAEAVNILGYYDFEGNFLDSSGNLNHAAAVQNPAQVTFTGAGFRGQAVDINDPGANGGGNDGGTVDIPIVTEPFVRNAVSWGGWFNLQTNNGFPGAMSTDNGGWDRGIQLNGNQWGIASGGNTNNISTVSLNNWQYVVATFDKFLNRATLYVGNDVVATQTTLSGQRVDGANGAINQALPFIEIGRYDNQDLDARVDDAVVWDEELTADEANAVRNLRLNPTLDYSPLQAELLFDLFDAGAGSVVIGSTTWMNAGGLLGTAGELTDDLGGNYTLVLNSGVGTGLSASSSGGAVPESSTFVLAAIGLIGLTLRRRRARR